MTRSVVGLDLDPSGARAAEVRIDRRGEIALERVSRIDLPPGVVRGGRVVDPDAVGDALAGWWADENFSTRSVVVGLASSDLRVAVVEEPLMTSEELDAAVRGTAPSTLGVTADDHFLDYQVIERVDRGDGGAVLRTLLVAAPRPAVQSLLAALERARLRPELLDLHAFALLRSLVDSSGDGSVAVEPVADDGPDADDTADGPETADGADAPGVVSGGESLVGISGGGAVVVVHEGGAPRRIAVVGPELEPFTPSAPEPTDGWLDATVAAVADIVRRPEAQEQPGRVRVAGPAQALAGLLPRLRDELGVPVEPADPLAAATLDVRVADPGESAGLSVAIGLALAGRDVAAGAHRLDLLPSRSRPPSAGRHAALAGAAVLATVVGLGALWLGRSEEADRVEADADRLEQELVELGDVVTDLEAVNVLADAVEEREALVREALEGDVAWTKLLQEIATVQPDDVWLREFVARAPTLDVDPGFTVSGRGTDHTSAARWLIRLQGLPTVDDVWVPRSQRAADEELNRFGEIEFDSSGELTGDALSDRIDFYVPPDPVVLGQESEPGRTPADPEAGPGEAETGDDEVDDDGPLFGDQDGDGS